MECKGILANTIMISACENDVGAAGAESEKKKGKLSKKHKAEATEEAQEEVVVAEKVDPFKAAELEDAANPPSTKPTSRGNKTVALAGRTDSSARKGQLRTSRGAQEAPPASMRSADTDRISAASNSPHLQVATGGQVDDCSHHSKPPVNKHAHAHANPAHSPTFKRPRGRPQSIGWENQQRPPGKGRKLNQCYCKKAYDANRRKAITGRS